MNLQEMMDMYYEDGLTRELAAARVCQDIVLKAIAIGPFSRNVTVKGGVVMRSLTNNNRRATRDIDLDFIHYSIEDESIREFIEKLNCIPGIKLEIVGSIEELKHRDYLNTERFLQYIKLLIFDDAMMRENTMADIVRRVENSFKDKHYFANR